MSWIPLQSEIALNEIEKLSFEKPQLILKHSTRCGISSMALRRLEQTKIQNSSTVDCHYLDLLNFQSLSNLIADKFQVYHESPQIILINKGVRVLHASHGEIDGYEILSFIENLQP
jgi:bacillithiol system protein YtxJ